ncbi:hypothetical protein L0156_12380, partial [bacterium]|nr:hypothetical protein [bacterium]
MPEAESEQVNVTVTSVLFHPAPFAAGFAAAVIVGGVLSLTVNRSWGLFCEVPSLEVYPITPIAVSGGVFFFSNQPKFEVPDKKR